MCGRYTLTPSRKELEVGFSQLTALPQDRIFAERFNVAPTQEVVGITHPNDAPAPVAELLRWGLVPHWAPSPDTEVKMINARAETVLEKPSYKGLIEEASGRCLIIADGFYEWEAIKGSTKQPWRFTVDGGIPFAFAGLCSTWTPKDSGPPLRSCVIITTEPNALVKPIHNRMPAILADQASQEAWLNPMVGGEEAAGLLKPLADSRMEKAKAAKAVGKPSNEGPLLFLPEQEGLF